MTPERRETFLDLVRTQRPRLQRLASSYAAGSEREDLLQEIYLQLWRSLPRYRGEAQIATWAYQVALNTALGHLRREIQRRPRVAATEVHEEMASVPPGQDPDLVLRDFLASLGPVDRAVLLGYLEGLSHEQTAGIVGSTAGAVATRISRLRDAFERRYIR